MVEEFEELVAEASNCRYAVAVSNGTVALEAMLRGARAWSRQDHILTSPLTFRATIQGIKHAGAGAPVYQDVDPDTLCMERPDVPSLEPTWVMPVDLYGRKSSYDNDWSFRDAAQSIGQDFSSSQAAAISFYATKNIAAGELGVVVTNNKNIYDEIRLLRNQGMGQTYRYMRKDGFNWRATELSAALAIPQLKRLGEINGQRKSNAQVYQRAFKDLPLRLPKAHREHSWHQYTCRSPHRDEIINKLNYLGVNARCYYPELVSPKKDWGKTPVALRASKEVFSLPVHHHLSDGEINRIIEAVIQVVHSVED